MYPNSRVFALKGHAVTVVDYVVLQFSDFPAAEEAVVFDRKGA